MEAHHRDDIIAQLSTAKQANTAAAAITLEDHQTEIKRLNASRTELEESIQRMTSENEKIRKEHERVCTTWKEEVDSLRSQLMSLTNNSNQPTGAKAEAIREDIMTSMQKDHQTVHGRLEQQLGVLMQRNTELINDNEILNGKMLDMEEKTTRSAEAFKGIRWMHPL